MFSKKFILSLITVFTFVTYMKAAETQKAPENFLSKNKTLLISTTTCLTTGIITILLTNFINQNKIDELNKKLATSNTILTHSDLENAAQNYEKAIQNIANLFQNKKNEEEITDKEISDAMNILKEAASDVNIQKMNILDMVAKLEFVKIIHSYPTYLDSIIKINTLLTGKSPTEVTIEENSGEQKIMAVIEDAKNENPFDLFYALEDIKNHRAQKTN